MGLERVLSDLPRVLELMAGSNPRSVLLIGVGHGEFALAIRQALEEEGNRSDRSSWKVRIDGIEPFLASNPATAWSLDREFHGDPLAVLEHLGAYDLVIMRHVLERFDFEAGSALVEAALGHGKAVIVVASQQERNHEGLVRVWKDEDFTRYRRITPASDDLLVTLLLGRAPAIPLEAEESRDELEVRGSIPVVVWAESPSSDAAFTAHCLLEQEVVPPAILVAGRVAPAGFDWPERVSARAFDDLGAAIRFAAEQAGARAVAVVSAGCRVSRGWLAGLEVAFRNESVGLATGAVVPDWLGVDPPGWWSAGLETAPPFRRKSERIGKLSVGAECPVSHSAFAIRADLADRIAPAAEEFTWVVRAQIEGERQGLLVLDLPQCVVYRPASLRPELLQELCHAAFIFGFEAARNPLFPERSGDHLSRNLTDLTGFHHELKGKREHIGQAPAETRVVLSKVLGSLAGGIVALGGTGPDGRVDGALGKVREISEPGAPLEALPWPLFFERIGDLPSLPASPDGILRYLCVPDWSRSHWAEVVADYLAAFGRPRPVELVLVAPEAADLEAIERDVATVIASLGFDVDEIPDIAIVPEQEANGGIEGEMRRATFVIDAPDLKPALRALARVHGKPLVAKPAADGGGTHRAPDGEQRVGERRSDGSLDGLEGRDRDSSGLTDPGAADRHSTQEIGPGSPDISVVIATYNRPDWLRLCLEGFAGQTLSPERFEVVVVDDCSTVDIRPLIDEISRRIDLKYIRQPENRGLGAARNTGVRAARGQIVLFFDDDDRPSPRLLEEHLETHREHPEPNVAVLGYTAWDPGLTVSPVMYHVTEVGKQYLSYPDIREGEALPWHYCWGGRSSLKRQILVEFENFDESFHMLEDMELAYRLRRVGLKVYYNPRAVGYALRPLDLEYFCDRWKRQGQGIAQLLEKHPNLELIEHFNVSNAEARVEQLEAIRDKLRSGIDQLGELPLERLRSVPLPEQGPGVTLETVLHSCYAQYFEYFRLKGYVDARARAKARKRNPSVEIRAGNAADRPAGEEESGNKRRVLIIGRELPLFDRSSGHFRTFQMVKLLRSAGHSVTFLARSGAKGHPIEPYLSALSDLGVEAIPYDPDRMIERHEVPPEGTSRVDLAALLAEGQFDAALLIFHEVAQQYLPLIRNHSPSTRVVVDSVDVHFLREEREAALSGDPERMARARATREAELQVYEQADLVLTVSREDREVLAHARPGLRIEVISNIHPVVEQCAPLAGRKDLLFVGGFWHRPNVDAMRYFLESIWPLVAERLPDIRLHIVGSDPPQELLALAGPRVIVTGYVPDLASYLNGCRVSIAPLRYGAGQKGKVGEALAAGLPVVATSIAAEGLDLTHGRDVLIADSPERFADEVVRLCTDDDLWLRLSAAGKAHVEATLSPGAIGGKLEEILFAPRPDLPAPAPRQAERTPAAPRREGGGANGQSPFDSVSPIGQYLVSIVIPCWNRAEYTARCLEAIAAATPDSVPYEVVLVDNGSTDATPDLLAGLEGDVQVLTNAENLGFARACNQGAAAARGRYVLFLNNDTEPRPGWLEAMLRVAAEEPDFGIAGAKLLYPDGTIQHAGVVFTARAEGKYVVAGDHRDKDILIDLLPYHLYRRMPADAPFVNRRRDFQAVTGACLLIENALFRELGGFDERYRNGFEDVDLCLKVLQCGKRVIYTPEAVLTHHESVSEGRNDHDLENARLFRERWLDFLVADDDRFYREDGFILDQTQERLTIYRWSPHFAEGERLFKEGRYREALAEFEAFLEEDPRHPGASIKAAVIRQRLALAEA